MPFQILNESKIKKEEIITKSFCWREILVGRYESLWSLLQKFALLNFIDANDLREIFALKSSRKGVALWKWRHRDDLRGFWGLDANKLTRVLNNNEKLVNESVVSAFVKKDELQLFSCENLRFCKKCLKTGFHSSLYQLLFLNRCPVHNEDLLTKCPNCGSNIPYKFNNSTFKSPYTCPQCEVCFCSELRQIGVRLSNEGREESLILIGDWLIKRVKCGALEAKISGEKEGQFSNVNIDSEITRLTSYWSDVYKTSSRLKRILGKQLLYSQDNLKIKKSFNSVKKNKDERYSDEVVRKLNQELFGIYKSIGRHFLKTALREHKSCINYYGRTLFWDNYTVSCKGRICEFASAFILWRMYFEGVRHPVWLFKAFKRTLYHVDNWDFGRLGYPEPVLKRVFALECFWVFYECLVLAHENSIDDVYSFMVTLVNKSLTPFWIVETVSQEKNIENYNMYYWIENSELLFVQNIERHFNLKCNSLKFGEPHDALTGSMIIRKRLDAIKKSKLL